MGDEYRDRFDVVVPADVKSFVKNFNRKLSSCDVYEIQNLYEIEFQTLTDRFFKGSRWPSAEVIKHADIIDSDDDNFLICYKELYFRHVYSKLAPTVDDRFDSFLNYTNLFNILLGLDGSKPELELPSVWLWDIIDEFIYQFRTFHQMRSQVGLNAGAMGTSDIKRLREAPHLWSAQTVLAYLKSMVRKGSDAGAHPFFHTMRNYALIGITRVMVLMSDYYGALETADAIDLEAVKQTKSVASYSALCYYLGSSYLMLRRYTDVIAVGSEFLIFVRRHRVEDSVPKRVDHINGLIAIALALAPQSVEDSVATSVRDKYGDKMAQMKHGDKVVATELFEEIAPKFVSPSVPDYGGAAVQEEASKTQTKLFVAEIRARFELTELQNLLRLCTTVGTKELCALAKRQPETLLSELISTKVKNKALVRGPDDGPSGGSLKLATPVNFFIKDGFIHVAQSPEIDRYGDYFMGQYLQFEYMLDEIRTIR